MLTKVIDDIQPKAEEGQGTALYLFMGKVLLTKNPEKQWSWGQSVPSVCDGSPGM